MEAGSMKIRLAGIRQLFVVLLAMAVLAVPATAQPSDPRAVAEAFFNAVAEERWIEAARHIDLESFDAFRKAQIASARAARPEHQFTVDDLLRGQPDMPPAVAEYQVTACSCWRASL